MKQALIILAMSAISMVGCAGGGVVYYANVPPPALRVEAYGVAPGPGYVWTPGYWGWRGNAHVWVGGRWAVPPRPHARWVAPYWEGYRGRYRFHEGRWR